MTSLTQKLLLLAFTSCFASAAIADNHIIFDVRSEYVQSPANGYQHNIIGFNPALGWTNGSWLARIGYNYSGRFQTNDNKYTNMCAEGCESNSGEIAIKGGFLEAVKIIDLRYLNLEVGGGLARNTLRTYLHDHHLGTTTSTDPFVSLGLSRDLTSFLALQLSTQYTPGVKDSNLLSYSFGVRFKL